MSLHAADKGPFQGEAKSLKPILVQTVVPVTREMISDVLCSALEAGIGYWCSMVSCPRPWPDGARYSHEAVAMGATMTFSTFDHGDHVAAITDIAEALVACASQAGYSTEEFYENHDSGDADRIVQLACFGEVVYG